LAVIDCVGAGRPPKSANNIDNSKHHKSRKHIDTRIEAEESIQPVSRKLECPTYLTNEAKAEWEYMVQQDNLKPKQLIYDCDSTMLETACELKSKWLFWQGVSKKAELENDIELFEKADKHMERLTKAMHPIYKAFGCTPLGRAGYGMEHSRKEEINPLLM